MNKQNNNCFEISIAVAFLAVIFIALLPYSWWPDLQWFDSDVWGTVSDWAMVVVTAITARYLYLTFVSQQKITNLQYLEFRRANNPVFEIELDSYEVDNSGQIKTFTILLQNKESECKITGLQADLGGRSKHEKSFKHLGLTSDSYLRINEIMYATFEPIFEFHIDDNDKALYLKVFFKDILENHYTQILWFDIGPRFSINKQVNAGPIRIDFEVEKNPWNIF